MAPWMRYSLGGAALLAWALLALVAITANVKFAYSLGHSDIDRYVLSAGSIASDLLKAMAPVAFLYFVATRRVVAALSVLFIGAITAVFSTTAAIGFMSGERFQSYYGSETKREQTAGIKADIARKEQELQWLPSHKPVAVLVAEKAAMEGDRNFRMTDGCKMAKGNLEQWCRDYRQIGVQIAAAEAAEKASKTISEGRQLVITQGRDYGDPQISTLSTLIGMKEEKVLMALIILAVLLIEVGSTLGLTVALALLTPPEAKSGLGRVIGKALSVIQGGRKPPQGDGDGPIGGVRVPQPPTSEAVSRAVPMAAGKPFSEPAAIIPDAGGLRAFLKPTTAPVPAAKISAA